MKSILYIMNVDWDWIKQRPHFIAEGLSSSYDVDIVYAKRFNRKVLQNNSTEGLNIVPIRQVPFIGRFPKLRKINDYLYNSKIKRMNANKKYDILYITYPTQIEAVTKSYEGKIIYDCMDNHPAFIENEEARKRLIDLEHKLMSRADCILTSSSDLINKLSERYGAEFNDKITVLRNGFNGKIESVKPGKKSGKAFKLAYIGTLSNWFNNDFVERSLSDIDNIEYVFIGPISDYTQINNSRVEYKGVVQHNDLYKTIDDVDCLIMPFCVNEIVESVDPVKLYEYINYNKNIITVYYDEIMRFEPYVHFYNTYDDYLRCIKTLINDNTIKYTDSDRLEFLKNNTWQNRIDFLNDLIVEM